MICLHWYVHVHCRIAIEWEWWNSVLQKSHNVYPRHLKLCVKICSYYVLRFFGLLSFSKIALGIKQLSHLALLSPCEYNDRRILRVARCNECCWRKSGQSQQPIGGKESITSSQWERKVKTSKPPKAWGNASDQFATSFTFKCDWLRGWVEFFCINHMAQ